jgi:hypothetical protein
MTSAISKCILSALLVLTFYSCDRSSCETDNPVLLNNEVLSKIYQREVVNQIELTGDETLRFWLSDYLEKNEQHYLVFYIQNDNLCAEAVMHIDHNDEAFSELIKIKGQGRFNAEFRGVTFDVSENDEDQFLLHYTGHKTIID